jgi:hypothetical protein
MRTAFAPICGVLMNKNKTEVRFMANMHLKRTILQVVDNQLNENNPPIMKITYERLLATGYTQKQAKEKLAAVALEEMYDVLKHHKPFNEERYAERLEGLN